MKKLFLSISCSRKDIQGHCVFFTKNLHIHKRYLRSGDDRLRIRNAG